MGNDKIISKSKGVSNRVGVSSSIMNIYRPGAKFLADVHT